MRSDDPINFQVSTTLLPSGIARVAVSGELDMATTERLAEAIDAAVRKQDGTTLRIDMGAVTFVDSLGIGALIKGKYAAGEHGVEYEVVNARGHARRVLLLTGVLEALTSQSDDDATGRSRRPSAAD